MISSDERARVIMMMHCIPNRKNIERRKVHIEVKSKNLVLLGFKFKKKLTSSVNMGSVLAGSERKGEA
jgi:hypothetical protein